MSGLINLWLPEPDRVTHQALGKLLEEVNELGTILARCLIQGIDASEPVTGKPNREQVLDEMADVVAATEWLRHVAGLEPYCTARADRKFNGFLRWQKMLEASLIDQAGDR